jgi:hypothetical protein
VLYFGIGLSALEVDDGGGGYDGNEMRCCSGDLLGGRDCLYSRDGFNLRGYVREWRICRFVHRQVCPRIVLLSVWFIPLYHEVQVCKMNTHYEEVCT